MAHVTLRASRSPFPAWLRLAVACLLLLFVLMPGASAQAHANLVRSDPPQGAALTKAPTQIEMEFTEELDPSFTNVQLLDVNSKVVVQGPGAIDASNHEIWRLQLPPIPDGIYSAVWTARSVVDGHITTGTIGFSVGAATPHVSLLPPPGAPDPATALPQPIDSVMRWLGYVALAVMLGGPLFGVLVWRPVYQQSNFHQPDTDRHVAWLIQRLSLIGTAGLVIATLGLGMVGVGQASGKPFLELFGPPLAAFVATRTGLLLGIRLLLIVCLAAVISRLPPPGADHPGLWWLTAVLGIGVIATFSLQSHADAAGQPLLVVLDMIHLLAVCVWIGGLLPLAILLTDASRHESELQIPPLKALIPRFSLVALVSVNLLVITGLVSAVNEIQSLDALTATSYGRTVLIKVALVCLVIGLGAVNLMILSPRLRKQADESSDEGRGFRWTTRFELVIAVAILAAAGVLTGLSPAFSALQAEQRLGYMDEASTDQVDFVLRVAPAKVGDDEFGVDVVDNRPGADSSQPQVLLRFSLVGRNIGVTQVETTSTDGKRFTARGTYLTLGGDWQTEVTLRRPGFDDVVYRFTVPIGGAVNAAAVVNGTPEPDFPNPVQPDSASVAAGKTLYTQNCVPCHGASGKGDGPVGLTLNPRPADLTYHTIPGVHTDGQLYLWITNGYPHSAMPAFGKYLSDTDRWNLVNYIRTLAQTR